MTEDCRDLGTDHVQQDGAALLPGEPGELLQQLERACCGSRPASRARPDQSAEHSRERTDSGLCAQGHEIQVYGHERRMAAGESRVEERQPFLGCQGHDP